MKWILRHKESNLYLKWNGWVDQWTIYERHATKFSTIKDIDRIIRRLNFAKTDYVIEPL